MSRRTFLSGAVGAAAGLAIGGPTLWAPPARSAAPARGVHLGFGADPTSSMVVSWSTPEAVAGARVELGQHGSFGRRIPADEVSAPGVSDRFHHATVDGLKPGTTYDYRISHRGGADWTGTFQTAPAEPGPFRFVTFGDMGVSDGARANTATILAVRPDLCFVVGDLCYADLAGGSTPTPVQTQDPTIWESWLDQVMPSTSMVPWMSTVGNHEMERNAGELGYDGYLARFRPPGSASMPVTYAFRYGNVGFVALDANDVSAEITRNNGYLGEEQDAWLDATLAELRRDPRIEFVVVGFHHCMYCSNAFHGSDGGPRQRWGATFDRHAVDLVINGHNHCYERTHPLRGGEVVDGGTVYVTAGGGGQAEYPTGTYPVSYVHAGGGLRVPEPALWSAVRFLHHSIAVVDVSPGLLHVRALDTAGAVADEFTVRSKVLARG